MRNPALSRKTGQTQLLESPVAALRRRNGLSRDQAAADLGISLLRLARLEAATRRLPARTLRSIAEVLSPADRSDSRHVFQPDRGIGASRSAHASTRSRGGALTVSDSERTFHRNAVRYWGDDISAMMSKRFPVHPGSMKFALRWTAARSTDSNRSWQVLTSGPSADSTGVTPHELAERLHVPFAYAFALDRGWKRLGTRGLLYVASNLGVSVGTFVRNDHWQTRPRVQIYQAFRLAEREVKHL